jgi:hypothetical protein
MNPLGSFTTLGDDVARSWEASNCTLDAFAEIATETLQRSGVLESTSLRDITDWFISSNELPPQSLVDFGQPPVRVYDGRGFYIELLFWVDTPTAIHQHSFSGAFGVLRGSSFHSQYRFERVHTISDELATGSLQLLSTELLQRGDVRPIVAGDAFIHSLLHLEPPSISVVVRTGVQRPFGPQMSYDMPGLAYDPFYREQPLLTQIALLKTLLRSEPELFRELAMQIVSERDIFFAYKVIDTVSRQVGDCEILNELLRVLALRDAGFTAVLEAALREERRTASIRALLKDVTNAEQRFLLALLITAPNRSVVDAMMRKRFPAHDPETKILELIAEMTANKKFVNFDKLTLRLFQFAIRGASFDDVEDAFHRRFGEGHEALETVRVQWLRLHAESPFSPMLGGAHAGQRRPRPVTTPA